MGLFGSKKPEGKTFVVLDVETGSVGGGLARLMPGEAPRLFGETRIDFVVGHSRDSETLRQKAAHALMAVSRHLAEVAARLRGHEATREAGVVTRAAAFLSAPWGTPDLVAGSPHFNENMMADVHRAMGATFDVPTHFHARASAGLYGARVLLPYEDTYLIGMPGGEITELLSVEQGSVRGYGTLPVGRHTLLRTLSAHGGMHEHEARSALRAIPSHVREPLRHAHEHIGELFGTLATEQGWHGHGRFYTMSHDNEWFARALSESSAARLFSEGATIKHLRGEHVSPYLAQHAEGPDLNVLLGALFVDSHYR